MYHMTFSFHAIITMGQIRVYVQEERMFLAGRSVYTYFKKKVNLSPCLHQLDRYHYYMNI